MSGRRVFRDRRLRRPRARGRQKGAGLNQGWPQVFSAGVSLCGPPEVVHLSYHRLGVESAAKDWEVSEVHMEIETALANFAIRALPSRLDDKTREALQEPMEHDSAVGARHPSQRSNVRPRGSRRHR